MTLHHFIGADKELPIGEYGRNPTLKPISELEIKGIDVNKCSQVKKNRKNSENSLVKVYDTEEDAYGIDIVHLDPGYEAVRNKFTHPYIYELQGYLHANSTPGQRKSIKSLFLFIEKHLSKGESIEIYSCLDGY